MDTHSPIPNAYEGDAACNSYQVGSPACGGNQSLIASTVTVQIWAMHSFESQATAGSLGERCTLQMDWISVRQVQPAPWFQPRKLCLQANLPGQRRHQIAGVDMSKLYIASLPRQVARARVREPGGSVQLLRGPLPAIEATATNKLLCAEHVSQHGLWCPRSAISRLDPLGSLRHCRPYQPGWLSGKLLISLR